MSEVSQLPPRNVLVSSVGGINILLALVGLCIGLACLVDGEEMSALLYPYTANSLSPPTAPAPPGTPSGTLLRWLAVTVAGVGITILSLVLLVAGLAILRRLPWGRTLALTLAVFSGPVMVLSLLNQDVVGASAAAGYNLLVFAVLLTPQGAAEFGSGGRGD
jgi:hypothetical protein